MKTLVPVWLITSSHPVRFSWTLCCLPPHTKTKAVVSASFPLRFVRVYAAWPRLGRSLGLSAGFAPNATFR